METEQLLERIGFYRQKLRRNLFLIGGCALILGLIMAAYAYFQPTIYIARAVVHPVSSSPQGSSLPNSLLSLIPGGITSSGTEELVGILKSRTLSEIVVKDSVVIDDEYDEIESFILDQSPKPFFSFFGDDSLGAIDRFNMATSTLRNSLGVFEQPPFLVVNYSTTHPVLAQKVNESYLKALEIYYNRQKTAKADSNYNFYTRRADSVKLKLNEANGKVAYYSDNFQYNYRKANQLKLKELLAWQATLEQLYITLEVSKEQALSQKQQQTEIIQILDPPKPPFNTIKPSTVTYGIGGVILGLILASLWAVRAFIKEDIGQLIQSSLEGNKEES